MRIPVASCEGCNQNAEITLSGAHPMGNGNWLRCKFIEAEISEFTNSTFLSAHKSKLAAVRAARKANAGILWVGQAPQNLWLVVK